ncbi:heme ABC transporter permease [Oecophyllibacter saccharovorans]|uniref:Heme exporter protein C n=1 Tax=Oecophyllibacter saccharovorans TaxID=2558360 RepID=A0A506ULU8_9PROT|nr:heme ABC transporter permease [Oecophyllibacter saccharovorans]TPW34321.1 heme ABC transporter permease [Oecophyllibacter saccharovorans]
MTRFLCELTHTLGGLGTPVGFLQLARRLGVVLGVAALLALGAGLVDGLLIAPPDWQQGENARIMYVHVPMAWLATSCYVALAGCSAAFLVWRHPLADLAATEIAPVGALAAGLCLLTGSLWGRPSWGTWWVWDARLTSMLILFFLYLGQITLLRAFDDPARGRRAAALLVLAGAVDLPVIKFSVTWWNTLHQPASLTLTGAPTISWSMLRPLLLCAIGFSCGAGWLILLRMRTALLARRVQALSTRFTSAPAAHAVTSPAFPASHGEQAPGGKSKP